MRRIFAILIIVLVAFLVAYGIVPSVKASVDTLMISTIGPAAFNAINAAYTGIITTIGVGGFAAIVLGFGFVVGIIVHLFWVKADWKLRRWGADRTRKDLGVTGVSHVSTTPAGATVRPETKEVVAIVEPVEQEPKESGEST